MLARWVRRHSGGDGSVRHEEELMTEPKMASEGTAEAAADPEPEVKPEVIQDLDVTGDDAARVVAGHPTSFPSLEPR
jgi:hypothetical protein